MAVLKVKCRKLCRPGKGPAIIVQKISSSLFRMQLLKPMIVVNHDHMKLCKDRALLDWVNKWLKDPEVQEEAISDDKKEYCFCRSPWQGRFMIQCNVCDEWYHGNCVDITSSEALNIDEYFCLKCK